MMAPQIVKVQAVHARKLF